MIAWLLLSIAIVPAAQTTDTFQAPAVMMPALEKYTTCLTSAIVAAQPTASSDFAALTEQALAGCRKVRAETVADVLKLLGPEAKPGDNAALVEQVFGHIDAAFPGLTQRLRDQIISESAPPAK